MSGLMFPKPRPRILDRREKKSADDSEYKRNAAIARERDGGHCRICGRHDRLSTHHVRSRQLLLKSPNKHAVENLLTVCWGPQSCHQDIEDGILRVFPLTDVGASGKVLVEKWDKHVKDYIVAMEAA